MVEPGSSRGFCAICMEPKSRTEMFGSGNICTHSFCRECIGMYISTRIHEKILNLKCPDPSCRGTLDPYACRPIIPPELFDKWEDALCESMIPASQKFYCPFQDCSALMVDDGSEGTTGNNEVTVTQSECPNCHRLFCAQCKVAWHAGLRCEEFRITQKHGGKSRQFDEMMLELVRDKKWKRCPKCSFIVERNGGCLHISCRCGFEFCYACGGKWGQRHSRCGLQI